MSEESYSLGKSAKKLGELTPILKDAHGNVIDGFHRQNENPDWASIKVDSVDTPQKLELARLAVNFCRRKVGTEEMENRITFLVGKCGMKPSEIAEQTGINVRTIYRHMPQELKKPEAKAISEGMKEGQLTRVSSFITTPEKPSPVECGCCDIGTLYPEKYEDVPVCVPCLEKLENGTITLPKPDPLETKPRVVEPPKHREPWQQRKAQMTPQVSSMEQKIATALTAQGIQFESQKRFCTQQTTPDFYFPNKNLALYLDGPVHEKRRDRDDTLRELLAKRHGVRVLSVDYEGASQQEQARVLGVVLEAMHAF